MPYEWISDNLGGGLLGLLGVLLVIVTLAFYRHLIAQIAELKQDNRELRESLNRLVDVVEAWTPEQQARRLKRS